MGLRTLLSHLDKGTVGGLSSAMSEFERSSEQALNEMDAKAAREYHRQGIREAIESTKGRSWAQPEKERKMKFDFQTMLTHVKAGKQCRRSSWPEGKTVYASNTTLRTMYLGKSAIYHGTSDFLADDWEIAIELFDFGAALEHVRQGGKVRRRGWQDPRTYIARYSPTSNEIWIHFPAGTRQEWRPYCYDFLHNDWIKVDVLPAIATATKTA